MLLVASFGHQTSTDTGVMIFWVKQPYFLLSPLPSDGFRVGLVGVSVVLTFIAGLIPSGLAAKKDPVEALRTE